MLHSTLQIAFGAIEVKYIYKLKFKAVAKKHSTYYAFVTLDSFKKAETEMSLFQEQN